DAVARRLTQLVPSSQRVLTAAAIVGDEVGLPRLASILGAGDDELRTAVDDGLAAGLLEVASRGLFRYRFATPAVAEACRHLAPEGLAWSVHRRLVDESPLDATPARIADRVTALPAEGADIGDI